jgi:aquaporin Z
MNKIIAEFIGTAGLVFAGTGSIIVNDIADGSISHLGISFVFGLIVIAMIYSIGNVSGAHINPAVTIGFAVARKFPLQESACYIAAQISGAIAASAALRLLFPSHTTLGATIPRYAVMQSFLLEVILTFLLMFVILNVSTGAKEKGIMAGVAVGGTVMLAALFGGPISGASMNPARSLGPALIIGDLQYIWLYICAPICGALLATPLCKIVQGNACCMHPDYPLDTKGTV